MWIIVDSISWRKRGNMKRNLALLLSLLMALSVFAGCGAKNQTEAPAENDGPSVNGSVIFDHDGVTVTTAGLDVEPTSAPKLSSKYKISTTILDLHV